MSKNEDYQKTDIDYYMGKVKSEEIKKKPKSRYYWEIIRDRSLFISGPVRKKR